MRVAARVALLSTLVILILAPAALGRPTGRRHIRRGSGGGGVAEAEAYGERRQQRGPDTVEIAGSRLPDCSHACGSCSPCRLVMVSFVCESLEEAETCPMAYKCMCNSKSYPVP